MNGQEQRWGTTSCAWRTSLLHRIVSLTSGAGYSCYSCFSLFPFPKLERVRAPDQNVLQKFVSWPQAFQCTKGRAMCVIPAWLCAYTSQVGSSGERYITVKVVWGGRKASLCFAPAFLCDCSQVREGFSKPFFARFLQLCPSKNATPNVSAFALYLQTEILCLLSWIEALCNFRVLLLCVWTAPNNMGPHWSWGFPVIFLLLCAAGSVLVFFSCAEEQRLQLSMLVTHGPFCIWIW